MPHPLHHPSGTRMCACVHTCAYTHARMYDGVFHLLHRPSAGCLVFFSFSSSHRLSCFFFLTCMTVCFIYSIGLQPYQAWWQVPLNVKPPVYAPREVFVEFGALDEEVVYAHGLPILQDTNIRTHARTHAHTHTHTHIHDAPPSPADASVDLQPPRACRCACRARVTGRALLFVIAPN